MATPVVADISTFFYPIGNTPAVLLTRDLPPELPADILLLGCGDVRNILFTLYMEENNADRQFDITCCDIQPTIIARNILLFSLVLDDHEGSKSDLIWKIYYHFNIDDDSLALLSSQSRKLHSLSRSSQSWKDSKYGRLIRFCDTGTLTRVRDTWESYCITSLNKNEQAEIKRLNAKRRQARETKIHFCGEDHVILTGVRSAAPATMNAFTDLPQAYQHYWSHGTTDPEDNVKAASTRPNPTFATSISSSGTLHYGTDPLLGFHLATAYTPLTNDSPLRPALSTSFLKAVEAAKAEFRAWVKSFRTRSIESLTLRFSISDAIPFSYALQHRRLGGDGQFHMCRGPYQLEPLVLDSEDYQAGSLAPLSFKVIDTSNLVDHVGAINLLVATSPLLVNSVSASLFTESLVRREASHSEYVDSILCGHLPTISMLLGLFPVEYWTNVSAATALEDLISDPSILESSGEGSKQMHARMTWKRPPPKRNSSSPCPIVALGLDELACARVLHNVYQNMFQHENLGRILSKFTMQDVKNHSLLYYHRGSFALLLRLVKGRVRLDWDTMMGHLVQLIEHDNTLFVGANYLQELHLQLHILGMRSFLQFRRSFIDNYITPGIPGLRGWRNIPPVLCVTMKVPRKSLEFLKKMKPLEIGTPILHCTVQAAQWQNTFAAIQIVSGEILTSGTRYSDDFQVKVSQQEHRWTGEADLVVSYLVPAIVLLQKPERAEITFGVQGTPNGLIALGKVLGSEMAIYKTALADEKNVFITRNRPHHTDFLPLPQMNLFTLGTGLLQSQKVRTRIVATVSDESAAVVSLATRLEIIADDLTAILKNGCEVETAQISPCSFIEKLRLGTQIMEIPVTVPVPVLQKNTKTRIARKSSYIEVEASVAGSMDWSQFSDFMYPIFLENGLPVLWNMTQLTLDALPTIDTAREKDIRWLITHSSGMFSARERALRDGSMASTTSAVPLDTRTNFKDSLFSMFMHFTGLQGTKISLFGLSKPSDGGIQILIFVSSMKLDLTNRTVVLDAAVLPLSYDILHDIKPFLQALVEVGVMQIKVDNDELCLWKQFLPGMVERCRTWKHRSSCEYAKYSIIPVSMEQSKTPLCSCGNGSLPANFITGIPKWGSVSKHFVRAAISPCFPAPFAEKLFDFQSLREAAASSIAACRVCKRRESKAGGSLLKCGGCQEAKYCSVDCQRADWKTHKKVCKK